MGSSLIAILIPILLILLLLILNLLSIISINFVFLVRVVVMINTVRRFEVRLLLNFHLFNGQRLKFLQKLWVQLSINQLTTHHFIQPRIYFIILFHKCFIESNPHWYLSHMLLELSTNILKRLLVFFCSLAILGWLLSDTGLSHELVKELLDWEIG